MSKKRISPKQMQDIISKMQEIYLNQNQTGKSDEPHYEHIRVDDGLIKIGFIPGPPDNPKVMDIQITYKEFTNGN